MSTELPPLPLMSAPTTEPPPMVVMQDVACRKCGYNLRGLSTAGRCPECGTPVGLSVMGDLLRFSDPNWILTLRRGITLILAGIVVLIFGMIGLAIMVGVKGPTSIVLAPVVNLAGYGLMLIGGWFLTEPDPSGVGEDQYGTSRRIIRIALITGAVNALISWIPQVSTIPPMVHMIVQTVVWLASLVAVVGHFAQLNYLSKLARRIPDDKLAGRAHFLMYAIGIAYGMMIVLGIIVGIAIATTGRGPQPNPMLIGGSCVMGIFGLGLIIFGLMYLDLLEKLRKRFWEQASAAKAIWAAGGPAAGTPPMA